MSGRENGVLVDESATAPEFRTFGSVQVDGRHPGP